MHPFKVIRISYAISQLLPEARILTFDVIYKTNSYYG